MLCMLTASTLTAAVDPLPYLFILKILCFRCHVCAITRVNSLLQATGVQLRWWVKVTQCAAGLRQQSQVIPHTCLSVTVLFGSHGERITEESEAALRLTSGQFYTLLGKLEASVCQCWIILPVCQIHRLCNQMRHKVKPAWLFHHLSLGSQLLTGSFLPS